MNLNLRVPRTRNRRRRAKNAPPFDILLLGPVPPPLGGISVHISRLAQLLDQAGFRVGILNHFSSTEAPFVVAALRKNPFTYFKSVKTTPAHLVHYHHSRWIQFFAVALSRTKNSRFLITLHAGEIEKHFPQISSPNAMVRRLTVWSLRRFDTVIVVNPTIASFLEERGLHPHIELIPAFISPNVDRLDLAYDPSLVDFLESEIVITATASGIQFLPDGSELYGIDTLLESFRSIALEHDNARVVIFIAQRPSDARSRLYLATLEKRLEDEGLGDRVMIVYGSASAPALRKSALFVRPTRADGDALSIREAQEAGVPVVASDVIPRPPGVATFATGDAADLTTQVLRALESGEHLPERAHGRADGPQPEFADELLRLYRTELASRQTGPT